MYATPYSSVRFLKSLNHYMHQCCSVLVKLMHARSWEPLCIKESQEVTFQPPRPWPGSMAALDKPTGFLNSYSTLLSLSLSPLLGLISCKHKTSIMNMGH